MEIDLFQRQQKTMWLFLGLEAVDRFPFERRAQRKCDRSQIKTAELKSNQ